MGTILFTPMASAQTVEELQVQTNTLIQQVIKILETQLAELQQQLATLLANQQTQVVNNQPVNIGMPVFTQPTSTSEVTQVVTSSIPQVVPSCSLSVSEENRTVTVSWTSVNIPTSTIGSLYDDYLGRYNGGVPEYMYIRDLPSNPLSESNQGEVGQISHATQFKAVFGDTVCYAQLAQ